MDAKQYEADLQYKGSFITECSFENNLIDAVAHAVLSHQIAVSVSELVPCNDPNLKSAYVRLILDGTYSLKNEKDASCKYHMVINGSFCIDKNVSDDEFIKKLWYNGSTMLYSIARSRMEVMSSMVLNNGKILLPMVNMYELLKAQSAEEKE